ncbi:MAG: DUF1638 domain-containing protein [Clostridiales bacterium]|jgi:hypothetical protein|nr:DUF1638 domain-containing protein [Clostridiales bacterium]
MRIKFIGCRVLSREIAYISYNSAHIIEADFLRQGLHNVPEKLNLMLQQEIDKINNNSECIGGELPHVYDAVALGYGLCSNALVGLKSGGQTLVVPRVHDCASLLLGSREAYQEFFDANSGGVYWYSNGWIENTLMPSKERAELARIGYTERFGEENADYLMEMEQSWLTKYKVCAYIGWDTLENGKHRNYTKMCADSLSWEFKELPGTDKLLRELIEGPWNEKYFLVVPPNSVIERKFDEDIICAAPV